MGKGKNKKNTKPKTDSNPLKSVNLSFPETMAAEDMQHVIARAILEAEEIKTQNDQSQRQKEHEELLKNLGKKECNSWRKKKLNDIKVFFKFLFIKKKYIKGCKASLALLRLSVSSFFGFIKWVLFILSILSLFFIPVQHLIGFGDLLPWSLQINFMLAAAIFFLLFCLFRMAEVETENMEDHNFLLGLFTSIISCVSLVIAIVAIVKGV